MENKELKKLKDFYTKIIKGWMMEGLRTVSKKELGENIIPAMSCFVFTEAIGFYLPSLKKDIGGHNNNQKCFYRCLFRLESEKYLGECDKRIRKETGGEGIYQLRNRFVHKYLPNIVAPRFIQVEVVGSWNNPDQSFPIISFEENNDKIQKIIVNSVKYIEELQKLVDDVYDKTFVKKDRTFIDAMRDGHNKLFENDKNKNKNGLIKIWDKTRGRCHFCGERLIFENYGKNKFIKGNWNIDHIFPKAMGGYNTTENYLPICGECNGLKWHRTGKQIQELMRYGLVSLREKRKGSRVGEKISRLYRLQQKMNEIRREKIKK